MSDGVQVDKAREAGATEKPRTREAVEVEIIERQPPRGASMALAGPRPWKPAKARRAEARAALEAATSGNGGGRVHPDEVVGAGLGLVSEGINEVNIEKVTVGRHGVEAAVKARESGVAPTEDAFDVQASAAYLLASARYYVEVGIRGGPGVLAAIDRRLEQLASRPLDQMSTRAVLGLVLQGDQGAEGHDLKTPARTYRRFMQDGEPAEAPKVRRMPYSSAQRRKT